MLTAEVKAQHVAQPAADAVNNTAEPSEPSATAMEEARLRDGLSQAWRLRRATLAPEKQQPRIMMMKVRLRCGQQSIAQAQMTTDTWRNWP